MRRPCRETVAAIVFAVVCVSAVMSGWAGEGSALSPEDVGRLAGGRPVVSAPLVEEPPVVDGNPEDAAWKSARPVTFRFMNAERTDAPKHKTSARAVCDREHLYVLFECEESNIAGLKTSSPALWMDDVCDLFLDVGRTLDIASGAYFSMQVNPKGRFHAIRGDGKPWPLSGTVAKGSVGADRWFAEFKVAFRDLGLDAGNFPKVWGVNFSRTRCADKKEGEETPGDDNEFAWIGNYVDTPHTPDRFGLLLLGVGNALPRDLAEAMKRDGRDPAAMGIKTWEPPREAPADIPPAPARKSAFARKPSVAKVEGGLAVEFEAEEETDATVTICGPDGKAVRHLAAGLLGNNAPVPFSKGSKSQRVVWDMKDDFGRPVPPGNYTVKVGLGLKASLDRAVAGDPQRVPDVVGLAVGPDGTLYVLAVERGGHYRAGFIWAYDRDGRYMRCLYPFPGRLPEEKVRGAAVMPLPGGGWMPVVHQGLLHCLIPEIGCLYPQRAAVSPGGRLVLVNTVEEIRLRTPKRLMLLGTDGSVPADCAGPIIAREPHVRGRAAIALSPDGKYAYVTGLAGKAWWPGPAHQVVYRFDLTVPPEMPKGEIAEPFLGEYGVAGSDEKHFKDPSGVSVDADGNLYVADRGNDRIAVFSPAGAFVRSIPVKAPCQAEVHARTGDIYVVSSEGKRFRLAKLAKAEDFRQTASIELIAADRTTPVAALDSSSERPAVWYVSGPREIRKLEDIGGAFKDLGEVIAARAGEGYPSMTFQALEVHYSGAKLHLHGPKGFGYLCDAATGEVFWNEDRRVYMRGMDGRLYSYDYLANRGTLIRRYDPDLKMLPFEKSEALSTTRSSPVPYLGYTVDRRGNVYVVTHDYESPHAVIRQYGPDGTLKNPKFFELPLPAMSSWAVATVWTDLDGSFYIACSLKETSATIPPEFRGRLPVETGAKPRARLSYEHLYGAVVKFGPNGGRVIPIGPDEKTPMSVGINYGGIPYCKAEGVEWSRVGISPLAYRNRDHIRCTCEHASFGMDLHGRLYVPDAFRQRVEVLDKNGNLLLSFGRYGNMDELGEPGSPHPGLAWPIRARASDDACFVADKLNRRIIRMKLEYAAAESVPVGVP